MLLGQSPAISPARAAYDAQKARTLGAQRQAAIDARNAAYKQAEEARTRNAILSGALAASGSFSARDYSRAALDAASAVFPPLGRSVTVVTHLNSGDLAAAGANVLGGVRKMATPLALFDIGKKLVSGKPEEAALSAMRTVGVAAFGPLILVGEGIFNFVKKQEQYATASLDEETRALYERFGDADSAESGQIMLAYADETRLIDEDSARLIRAADALEDFALPGQFIGEGEPVPVNVLAAVSAMSDTGESGYTPVATRSPDGEIFYDERFLPVFEEVIDAIALGAAAAEMSGEYPADGFLDGAWQLPVMSTLPSVPASYFPSVAAGGCCGPYGVPFTWFERASFLQKARAEYVELTPEEYGKCFGSCPPTPEVAVRNWERDRIAFHGDEIFRLELALNCKFLTGFFGPSLNPNATSDSEDCSSRSLYTGPSSPGDPYIGPESAPSLYTGPSSPYTGPGSPDSPYTGPGSPDSPYTGPGSDSSGPYSVQPVPALPVKAGGFIVPGAVEPVKRPFPWWIVIATVILS